MSFLLKFILENGRIDWSKAPEIIAGPAWNDYGKYIKKEKNANINFFTFLTKIHSLGNKIHKATYRKEGYFAERGITFAHLLIEAKQINSKINLSKKSNHSEDDIKQIVNKTVQNIIQVVWPAYLLKKKSGYKSSFYRYAATVDSVGKNIYRSTVSKKSLFRKKSITFDDLLKKAKELNPKIEFVKRKMSWDKASAINAMAEEVWPAFKAIENPAFNFFAFASKKHKVGSSIFVSCRKKNDFSFLSILESAKKRIPEMDIEPSRTKMKTIDDIVNDIVNIVLPDYLLKKKAGYEGSFYLYAGKEHPATKNIYNSCTKKKGVLKKRGITFESILKSANRKDSRIDYVRIKTLFRLEDRDKWVHHLATESWENFKQLTKKGYSADFYTYISKVDAVGNALHQSCTRSDGVFHNHSIKFIDLVKEAQNINPQIKFKVQRKNDFSSQKNLFERLAKIIAKRIWQQYLKLVPKNRPGFYHYATVIHPFGRKIYQRTVNRNGFLKKQNITFIDLLKKANTYEPNLNYTAPAAWNYQKASKVMIEEVVRDYLNLEGLRPSFFRYTKLTHPEGKKVYSWANRQEGTVFHDLLAQIKALNPEIFTEKPVLASIKKEVLKKETTKKEKIKVEKTVATPPKEIFIELEPQVEEIAHKVWPRFLEAVSKGYRGFFITFASKIDTDGQNIYALTKIKNGSLHLQGIDFQNLLQKAKKLNTEIYFEKPQTPKSIPVKKEQKPKAIAPVESKPPVIKEVQRSRVVLPKLALTEKEKDRNKIKKLWPEYLEQKKQGTTDLLFRDYVKNSTVGIELSQKYVDFEVILEATIKEIVKPTEGVQSSSEAYFKFMRVLAERIQLGQ